MLRSSRRGTHGRGGVWIRVLNYCSTRSLSFVLSSGDQHWIKKNEYLEVFRPPDGLIKIDQGQIILKIDQQAPIGSLWRCQIVMGDHRTKMAHQSPLFRDLTHDAIITIDEKPQPKPTIQTQATSQTDSVIPSRKKLSRRQKIRRRKRSRLYHEHSDSCSYEDDST